jgi:predicted acyl esterase
MTITSTSVAARSRSRSLAIGLALAVVAPLLPVALVTSQASGPVTPAMVAPDLVGEARKVPPPASHPHGFLDVPATAFFDQAAAWLKAVGITTGFGGSTTTFAPNAVVSRGQMAAFLWRLMNEPRVPGPHGFGDVPPTAFYNDALPWLKARGITTGFGGNTAIFNPNGPVTRGQMAAFLYRVAGEPAGSPPHGFTDVASTAYFNDAVAWLKAAGITTGFGGSTTIFNPNGPVTRGQMAAFLYRLAGAQTSWAVPFTARGSVNQVSVVGVPGALVAVYDEAGNLAETSLAPDPTVSPAADTTDALGGVLFTEIDAGTYTVVYEAPGEDPVGAVVVVTDPEDTPPQALFDSQTLVPGFQYVTTRDGTRLSAMVTLPGPVADGPYPTLVEYSGYDLSNPYDATSGSSPYRIMAPQLGYALVQVNMRGSGCSGGAFDYFEVLQSLDGYDIIETVAAQTWSKKVGMVGISYPGISQLFVAQTQPPSLAAITPVSVISDTYRSVLYPGGIFNNGFALSWAQGRDRETRPTPNGHSFVPRIIAGEQPAGVDGVTPAASAQCAFNQKLRLQNRDLEGTIGDLAYYQPDGDRIAPYRFVDKIKAATFIVGAWQDEQTGGHFPEFLSKFDPDTYVRFIGSNGVHAEPFAPENLHAMIEFLDFHVKEAIPVIPLSVRLLAPVLYSLLLEQEWPQASTAIPPDRFVTTPATPFATAFAAYRAENPFIIRFENGAGPLGDQGGKPLPAFSRSYGRAWPLDEVDPWELFMDGNGSLTETAPTVADPEAPGAISSYLYDPDAYPDTNYRNNQAGCGSSSMWRADPKGTDNVTCYNWLQPPVDKHLSFMTGTLEEDKVMVGPAEVELWFTSTAPDVDVEVVLTEVRPDGQEMYVQSGYLRASHRTLDVDESVPLAPRHTHLEADASPLPAGEYVKLNVQIHPFAHVFREGSRIRITIEAPGGNRPLWKFDALPADGEVRNFVSHLADMPSRVLLPLVTGETAPTPLAPCAIRSQPCRTVSNI